MKRILAALSAAALMAGFAASAQLTQVNTPGPVTITGMVTDPSGAPAANVQVMPWPPTGPSARDGNRTDAQGKYSITWQPPQFIGNGRYGIVARDEEHNFAVSEEIDAQTTSKDLRLKPGLVLSGTVVDGDGRAVAGSSILVNATVGSFGTQIARPVLDASGAFEVRALPRGIRYTMLASATGYGRVNRSLQDFESQTATLKLDPLVLKPANRPLAGVVLDADGKPVSGAQVQASGDGQPGISVRSDSRGRFELKVSDGPVRVLAVVPNGGNGISQMGNVQAQAGDTNVIVRINTGPNANASGTFVAANPVNRPNPMTITGTVTDASGAPAADVHVGTLPLTGTAAESKTDAQGKYSVTWQPPPIPNGATAPGVSIVARDPARNLAAIAPIDEKTTKQDLRLDSGLTLSGTVVDDAGQPVTTATLQLIAFSGNRGSTLDRQPMRVDSQGAFVVPGLPQGLRYNLSVRAPDHGQFNQALQASETTTAEIKLPPMVLKLANLALAGQVLGPDGKPISGAQVQCTGTGQPSASTRTDSQGHFELKVCEGRVQVIAFDNGTGGGGQATSVQAQGGDKNVVIRLGASQPATAVTSINLNGVAQARVGNGQPKPLAWTLASIRLWPLEHKRTIVVLLSLQAVVLASVAGGIFWFTRPEREYEDA